MNRINSFLALLILITACQGDPSSSTQPAVGNTLFTRIPSSYSRVTFANQLEYDETLNPYTYRNFFNGGGVGIGDINNDGLPDLFFCGNLVDNKLYLNKGNFQFEDITEQAGVASPGVWTAGVSIADVNGDGWLDIYLCKAGPPGGERRHNELFINNGDGTFSEQAEAYGIADLGLSSHAAFFDYDRDGDLDCYLLNNSLRTVGGFDLRPGLRERRDPDGGNKLYRQDRAADGTIHFTDVSEEAGIYGSAIGFGLGVTIGDVDRNGWLDIYVSNDFFERDYLYLNQGDGTFREVLTESMGEISMSSMGADLADVTNDGRPEIFVTDMLPEDDARMKTKTKFDNWDKYHKMVEAGYHRQFTRNVFQYNRGIRPGDRLPVFSEIGRMAGVYATDWSWGALIADLDIDGRKDIFVANGIYKDLTDQDYINFYSDPNTIRQIIETKGAVIRELIDAIPSEPLSNYAFYNAGGLQFVNKSGEWGLGEPGFSNGSAYADLDNDGDLDLVLNNVNSEAWIYRNESTTLHPERHWLGIILRGPAPNQFALGSQVEIFAGDQVFYQELTPMRGFQSTVDNRLFFGLGSLARVDSIRVQWPDGTQSTLESQAADQILTIEQETASVQQAAGSAFINYDFLMQQLPAPDFLHRENEFTDFDRDQLIYHMLSAEGPALAGGDVDGDGLLDFHVGGAKSFAGAIFRQKPDGSFEKMNQPALEGDATSEDTDAAFFDADGDGDLDLYVCSGGNEFSTSSRALFDRLYLNDGRGHFSIGPDLPFDRPSSSSCVTPADFDGDGDTDLFVGTRLIPFLYGVPADGYLLRNDNGVFRDVTAELAPELKECGMITDACWADLQGDGLPELVVVGDWMAVNVFHNEGGQLKLASGNGLQETEGFWQVVVASDLDDDGDVDLILGNQGLNSRIRATPEEPASMIINDFDHNGTAEQLISVYNGRESYPLALRHDLVAQIPELKKKYLKYENYKEQTVDDIFTPTQLEGSIELNARLTTSMIAWNRGDGTFSLSPLPTEAQFSSVFAIHTADLNGDGRKDLLLGGNFYRTKPEIGIQDAGFGLVLVAEEKEVYRPLEPMESGLYIQGEIRDFLPLETGRILVARNSDSLQLWKVNRK